MTGYRQASLPYVAISRRSIGKLHSQRQGWSRYGASGRKSASWGPQSYIERRAPGRQHKHRRNPKRLSSPLPFRPISGTLLHPSLIPRLRRRFGTRLLPRDHRRIRSRSLSARPGSRKDRALPPQQPANGRRSHQCRRIARRRHRQRCPTAILLRQHRGLGPNQPPSSRHACQTGRSRSSPNNHRPDCCPRRSHFPPVPPSCLSVRRLRATLSTSPVPRN